VHSHVIRNTLYGQRSPNGAFSNKPIASFSNVQTPDLSPCDSDKITMVEWGRLDPGVLNQLFVKRFLLRRLLKV